MSQTLNAEPVVKEVPETAFPAPPSSEMVVAQHAAGASDVASSSFHVSLGNVLAQGECRVEAFVFLPSEFDFEVVDLVFFGLPGTRLLAVDLTLRDQWQQLVTSAKLPASQSWVAPGLSIRVRRGAILYSTGWTVRGAKEDGEREQATPITRTSLNDLTRTAATSDPQLSRVQRQSWFPEVEVPIPPSSFGCRQPPPDLRSEWPKDSWLQASYTAEAADLFTISDVVVHGEQGFVTLDHKYLVSDTLYLNFPQMAGFERDGDDYLLRKSKPSITLERAGYALGGYVGSRNYAHWWMNVVPALMVPPFETAFADTVLLLPEIRSAWQSGTLDLFPEIRSRSLYVGENTAVACKQLLYVPRVTQSDVAPHPFRRRMLDIVKERAQAGRTRDRRIIISRKDAANRPLTNEPELIAIAAEFGFEPAVLSGKSVTEQIRLFASASHVIGAHGAGLVNVLFCQPGSVLFELHLSSALVWSIRRMAAISRLRYGCMIGHAEDDSVALWQRRWYVDPVDFRRALSEMPSAQ